MSNDLQHYRASGDIGAATMPESSDVLAHFAAARAMIRDQLQMPEYQRDHDRVMQRLRVAAIQGGPDFYYSWRAGGELIEGPSIKAAQAILNAVGGVAVVPTHVTEPDAWVFTIWLVDRDSMSVQARQYRQRRDQKVFSEKKQSDPDTVRRQEDMVFSIGQSKAIRNLVVRVFEFYSEFAVRESKLIQIEKAKADPVVYKARISQRLGKMHVPLDRVARWIGRGAESWTPEDMIRIGAALNAVAEGVEDADALWPDPTYASGPPPGPKIPPPPPAGGGRDQPPPAEPDPSRL